jgi:cupin fold WbuC family metalloprotein
MIESIEDKNQIYALIIRSNYEQTGVNFITSPDNPLQVGIIQHSKGTTIKPHNHNNYAHTIDRTQEVLHVEQGKIEAEFYDMNNHEVAKAILSCGDTIVLISGGHGFKILEETKIIEVKQGPYEGVDKDKTRI